MTKYIFLTSAFFFFVQIVQIQGQDIQSFVDIHANSSRKAFNSRSTKVRYNVWEPMYHECGEEEDRAKTAMQNFGDFVPKQSQSHLEALIKGNTRIACLNISPIEQPFITTNNVLTDKLKSKTISCVAGIDANQLFLRRKEIDYFKDLVEHISFIERFEKKPYIVNGIEYDFTLLRDRKGLEAIAKDPSKLGLVLTVEGGHALGHSIYINDGITGLEEYRDLVLENVDRLKGSRPLIDGSDVYLDAPILWISLCKNYANGLGGNAVSLSKTQQSIYTKVEGANLKETKLGVEVMERLLSKEQGRRILVDIKHMSLEFRARYYKSIERSEILGDNIPVVCSHCGISGLSKRNALYKKKDDDTKNSNSYLNHWQQNLCAEDISKIYASRGLIGITLDKSVLAGETALTEINQTLPNTLQRRKACIKLLMANMLTVVQVINDASAWNILSIGSDFDEMVEPLDVYATSEDLPQLAVDIQRFLERPEAINDLFTEEDIRELMFDLTPAEITNMIMSVNAYNFIRKNIGNIHKE